MSHPIPEPTAEDLARINELLRTIGGPNATAAETLMAVRTSPTGNAGKSPPSLQSRDRVAHRTTQVPPRWWRSDDYRLFDENILTCSRTTDWTAR